MERIKKITTLLLFFAFMGLTIGCSEGVPDFKSLLSADQSGAPGKDPANDQPTAIPGVQLNAIASQSLLEGNYLKVIDANNQSIGDKDSDGNEISYECYYDTVIDGNVSAGSLCTSLIGARFIPTRGKLFWRPRFNQNGDYEFKIIGTAGGNNGEVLTSVTVNDSPVKFRSIRAGMTVACGLSTTNNLYCWGRGDLGQLGTGGASSSFIPIQIDGTPFGIGEKVVSYAVGGYHSCAITSAAKTYCWGVGAMGRLGYGSTSPKNSPFPIDSTPLAANEYFTKIVAGKYHTCGLTNVGAAYCWGDGGASQIGNGSLTDMYIPTAVDLSPLSIQQPIDIFSGVESSTSCLITDQNKVFCWGADTNGALGDGGSYSASSIPSQVDTTNLSFNEDFLKISMGAYHSCGITNLSNIYCWGGGGSGTLGNGSSSNHTLPVLFSNTPLSPNEHYVSIETGSYITCAISNFGNSYCSGQSSFGEFGDGSTDSAVTTPRLVPISDSNSNGLVNRSLGAYFGCGLLSNFEALCWGKNSYGQLGDGSTSNSNVAISVDMSSVASPPSTHKIALGHYHGCQINQSGQVSCTGQNDWGKLADDQELDRHEDFSISLLPQGTDPKDHFLEIEAGLHHTCGKNRSGKFFCWGDDSFGQLGNDSSLNSSPYPMLLDSTNLSAGESFKSIFVGDNHSCAIGSKHNVYCWGSNSHGQLSDASLADRAIPTLSSLTNLSGGEFPVSMALGSFHSCLLTNLGAVYCAGQNSYGQIGDGTNNFRTIFTKFSDGVLAGQKIKMISAGGNTNCSLTSSGNTYCWGAGDKGQLGNSTISDSSQPVLIDSSNLPTRAKHFISLQVGEKHACGVGSDHKVYCWGDNSQLQLDLDAVTTYKSYPEFSISASTLGGEAAIQVKAKGNRTCAVTTNSKTSCWGEVGDLANTAASAGSVIVSNSLGFN